MPKKWLGGHAPATRSIGQEKDVILNGVIDAAGDFLDLVEDLNEAMGTLSMSLEVLGQTLSRLRDQPHTSTLFSGWQPTPST